MKATRLLPIIGWLFSSQTRAGGGREKPSRREENETSVLDTFQAKERVEMENSKRKISISFVSTPTSTILTLTI